MQLDLSQDFDTIDDLEPIRYTSVRLSGSMQAALPRCKRRALTRKELAASGGVYQANDVALLTSWRQIQGLASQGREPKPGDTWQSGGDTPASGTGGPPATYTVLEVTGGKRDGSGHYQTWRLTSRNLVLAFDLQDTIDIQLPTIIYDAAGTAIRTWPENGAGQTIYPGLAARVQLISDDTVDERGIRGFVGNYAVIVATQVPAVTMEARIRWPAVSKTRPGIDTVQYLDIKGVHNPSRIDELPVLDALLPPL
jgi:hypothetical protein